MISHQIESSNKEIEILKRIKIEILELKSTTEMKNLLERHNSRFKLAGDRISELNDRSTEIFQSKNQKQK